MWYFIVFKMNEKQLQTTERASSILTFGRSDNINLDDKMSFQKFRYNKSIFIKDKRMQ